MKTLHAFLIFLMIATFKSYGQGIPTIKMDPPELVCEKLYTATIVMKKGDTLKGHIKWINRQANQRRVQYYKTNSPKEKPIVIRGVNIKTYTIENQVYDNIYKEGDKTYLWPDVMVYRVLDGGISLYQVYTDTIALRFKVKNDTNYYDVCRKDKECSKVLYAYKNGERASNLSDGFAWGMNYKENMAKLVAENKEMAQKVIDKEKGYRMIHRDKIILEYNEWYKQNKQAAK